MTRILGVVLLLAALYAGLYWSDPTNAFKWTNLKDVLSQQAFFGVLTVGVGVLILTGGIDLSIGSVVGFSAVLFGVLIRDYQFSPVVAAAAVLGAGVVIGGVNAALITGLKLQPFLVTLCGLFVYRGAARMLSPSLPVGLQQVIAGNGSAKGGLEFLRESLVGKDLTGELGFPMQLIVLGVVAAAVGVLLHASVLGRYWYALGHNAQAARYAGINVGRHTFAVYVLCSTLAALAGLLMFLDYGSATSSTAGETWELYAITGAVLGGCSLRGGEGTVWGMVLGAAVLPLLKNLINFVGDTAWVKSAVTSIDPVIPALIGLTLLFGTIADEFFRRRGKS